MHPIDKKKRKDEAIKAIKLVYEKLKKTPTIKEYKQFSTSSIKYDLIIRLFESWANAVKEAGLEPNPDRKPPRRDVSKEMVIEELIRVANEIGKFPSHPVFSSRAKISRGPVERIFGSWKNAKIEVLKNYRHLLTFKIDEESLENEKEKNDLQRTPLSLSLPLLYEPSNENETIALFILLCEKLGYKIKQLQNDFPDAILLKDNQEIKAEFEFLSSNYEAHGHQGKDILCICWRKDKEIPGINIIDLESIIYEMTTEK